VFQMVVGSGQPIVVFSQQPQQPYFSVPQADLMMTGGAPSKQTRFKTFSVLIVSLSRQISLSVIMCV